MLSVSVPHWQYWQSLPVVYEVPQGSIIGLVFFLVNLNDLDQLGDNLLFANGNYILAESPYSLRTVHPVWLVHRVSVSDPFLQDVIPQHRKEM